MSDTITDAFKSSQIIFTDYLTDFHTHLLPEMDDGSSSIEESIQMMEMAAKQGVYCMVLTPHFYAHRDTPAHFLNKREQSLQRLKQHTLMSLPLLIPGAEVSYFNGITAMDELPQLCIETTNLLLLEMPFKKWSTQVLDEILELNHRNDIQLVIAHIERYIHEQPKGTLEYLVKNQILIQANAESFFQFFKRNKVLKMLENGLIHLLGSDCHNTHSRPPQMGECIRMIRSKLGNEAVERVLFNSCKMLFQQDQRIKL